MRPDLHHTRARVLGLLSVGMTIPQLKARLGHNCETVVKTLLAERRVEVVENEDGFSRARVFRAVEHTTNGE